MILRHISKPAHAFMNSTTVNSLLDTKIIPAAAWDISVNKM
jgi:hypothetical protein